MSPESVKWQTEGICPYYIIFPYNIRVFGNAVSYSLVRFGKPLFPTYQTPRFQIPKDSNLHSRDHVSPRCHFCLQLVDIVLALRELLSVPCRISRSSLSNRSNGKSFVCLLEYEGFESLFLHSTRVVTSCEHRNSDASYFFLPNLYS